MGTDGWRVVHSARKQSGGAGSERQLPSDEPCACGGIGLGSGGESRLRERCGGPGLKSAWRPIIRPRSDQFPALPTSPLPLEPPSPHRIHSNPAPAHIVLQLSPSQSA